MVRQPGNALVLSPLPQTRTCRSLQDQPHTRFLAVDSMYLDIPLIHGADS